MNLDYNINTDYFSDKFKPKLYSDLFNSLTNKYFGGH